MSYALTYFTEMEMWKCRMMCGVLKIICRPLIRSCHAKCTKSNKLQLTEWQRNCTKPHIDLFQNHLSQVHPPQVTHYFFARCQGPPTPLSANARPTAYLSISTVPRAHWEHATTMMPAWTLSSPRVAVDSKGKGEENQQGSWNTVDGRNLAPVDT